MRSMKDRLLRLHDEQGITLPIVALLMVALCGMVALSLDIGQLTLSRRRLQNAVDAASLAGGQELPDDTTAADVKATSWSYKNGIGGTDAVYVQISSSRASAYIIANGIQD